MISSTDRESNTIEYNTNKAKNSRHYMNAMK